MSQERLTATIGANASFPHAFGSAIGACGTSGIFEGCLSEQSHSASAFRQIAFG
jgi:hypothetical protein